MEAVVNDVQFVCFFCGESADETEITLGAFWSEDGNDRAQHWAAHRRCLIDHMAADVRSYGGPLTGD